MTVPVGFLASSANPSLLECRYSWRKVKECLAGGRISGMPYSRLPRSAPHCGKYVTSTPDFSPRQAAPVSRRTCGLDTNRPKEGRGGPSPHSTERRTHGTTERNMPGLRQGNSPSRTVSVHILPCAVLRNVRGFRVRDQVPQVRAERADGTGPVCVQKGRGIAIRGHGSMRGDLCAAVFPDRICAQGTASGRKRAMTFTP